MGRRIFIIILLLGSKRAGKPDNYKRGWHRTRQAGRVKRDVKAALKKTQQVYKVDIFGLGEAVHRKYPNEWKELKSEWSDSFPEVQVDIQVKSVINHTGLTLDAPEPGQK